MSFDVAAEDYQRFMGRYSEPLATLMTEHLRPAAGLHALDVGAGTGALTASLVEALGVDAVTALEPSGSFVAALRQRFPGLDVREGSAEAVPFPDAVFDLTGAQLVVHFMSDPVRGVGEMARVTKRGGTVAATVWDFAGGRAPLSLFWRAVRGLDDDAVDESSATGAGEGQLGQLFAEVGLHDVREAELEVQVPYRTFDEWWQPFTLGVGPAGAYVQRLGDTGRARLRATCEEMLPPGPDAIRATAWAAFGRR